MFGYGRYSAWLETAPIDRLDLWKKDDGDIYSNVRPWDSMVLWYAGPCSTICLAGTRLGTDKIDHFFGEGHTYFRKSDWGRDPEAAVAWGQRTERGKYGLGTSGAYSNADLHANYEGYLFYASLLTEDSIVQRDEQGCAARVGVWSWADWIDPDYDEALNPSIYTRRVQQRVVDNGGG